MLINLSAFLIKSLEIRKHLSRCIININQLCLKYLKQSTFSLQHLLKEISNIVFFRKNTWNIGLSFSICLMNLSKMADDSNPLGSLTCERWPRTLEAASDKHYHCCRTSDGRRKTSWFQPIVLETSRIFVNFYWILSEQDQFINNKIQFSDLNICNTNIKKYAYFKE